MFAWQSMALSINAFTTWNVEICLSAQLHVMFLGWLRSLGPVATVQCLHYICSRVMSELGGILFKQCCMKNCGQFHRNAGTCWWQLVSRQRTFNYWCSLSYLESHKIIYMNKNGGCFSNSWTCTFCLITLSSLHSFITTEEKCKTFTWEREHCDDPL